jgi:O-methyltransferase
MSWARRINSTLRRTIGVEVRRSGLPYDFSPELAATVQTVQPFTMIPPARIDSICRTVDYIVEADIPGDIVECGVWRGGAMMAAALQLVRKKATDRTLWLYDTFAGMPDPDDIDVNVEGKRAVDVHDKHQRRGSRWAAASIGDVRSNMASTGYPVGNVRFVEGLVEDTLPETIPDRIAMLRLDTDFYSSTRHELDQLVPRIAPGGVLIVDDYGSWDGARKAVDEYFVGWPVLLHRVDESCRAAIINPRLRS